MKKLWLSLIICISLVMSTVSFVYAAEDIFEKPNINIIIDGKLTKCENTPIIVNGSSLLPLREMLTKLGVPNDDKHIIWNSDENSVTILHDISGESKKTRVKLYLRINSITAYVNDNPVILDAAPILYKDSTYIPLRFIAENLEKKVVWDAETSSILIKNEKDYNGVKEVLGKSNEAMGEIDKLKFKLSLNSAGTADNTSLNSVFTGAGEIDRRQNIIHMIAQSPSAVSEENINIYLINNALYALNPSDGIWQKTILPGEQQGIIFNSLDSSGVINPSEVTCAGFAMEKSEEKNEFLLKGEVYPAELYNRFGMNIGALSMNFNKFRIEVTIDSKTYLVKGIVMLAIVDVSSEKDKIEQRQIISINYSDYNGKFDMEIPQEVLNAPIKTN